MGAFPDGQSCLNLAAARLRYIAGTAWSTKCYMNMRPLYQPQLMQTESRRLIKCAKNSGHYRRTRSPAGGQSAATRGSFFKSLNRALGLGMVTWPG